MKVNGGLKSSGVIQGQGLNLSVAEAAYWAGLSDFLIHYGPGEG